MGHERLGLLPRRKPWSEIVSDLMGSVETFNPHPSHIANRILEQVKHRYKKLYVDEGVRAAFSFLIALSSKEESTIPGSLTDILLPNKEKLSAISLTSKLVEHVHDHTESEEYAELGKRAAADTIAYWTKVRTRQHSLFGAQSSIEGVWKNISGTEFCEISRFFFSSLTERYLRYFLERNLTSAAQTIEQRDRFSLAISSHLKDVSQHAFETSKITESFAAGWFNKHAADSMPNDMEVVSFLRVSLGKIQEELTREHLDQ